jgi:hypothetical protein
MPPILIKNKGAYFAEYRKKPGFAGLRGRPPVGLRHHTQEERVKQFLQRFRLVRSAEYYI